MSRRILIWSIVIAMCVWVAATIYLGEISLRLPRKPVPAELRWAVVAPETVEVVSADRLKLRGWFFRAPKPNGGTVVVLHGQTDNRAGMIGFADFFARHGYDVLTPDSRAHGSSEGSLATYGFREGDDVHRWIDWLRVRQPGGPIFGLGESMGGAILLQSLSVERRFCAVAVEAPYATLREIAYDRLSHSYNSFPLLYAVRPILETSMLYQRLVYGVDLGQVSPQQAVAHSTTPVLLIHGSKDDNTPARHAQSIYRSNPATVTPWEVPGAGHTGAWNSRPQEFERRLLEWFSPQRCH
jgi:alpha-beta hydrolase superfamily lysophospholipase